MITIGIADISSITFIKKKGDNVKKGDELGNFKYGGSLVVLLFEEESFN